MSKFDQLGLIPPICKALDKAGYHQPTPIQAQTIPQAIAGHDVLGCAQTGTGKTAAFALPILNHVSEGRPRAIPHCPLALVLAPARELAIQIGESFSCYGRNLPLKTALVYGGVNQSRQVRQLERGVHILVATPGRLLDLMQQREISLDQLSMFVLDEADRMLDMGFLPDLKRIIKRLPTQRQSLFFSATLPPKIIQLAKELLYKPVHVNVTPKSKSVDRIDQQVMLIDRKTKQQALNVIASGKGVDRLLAFTRTKRTADRVMRRLEKAGVSAAAIHGNKSQNARVRALESFRGSKVRVLVATDVASRGIDVDGVTHVVNFDMPEDPESYLHRIGRTGRAGSRGNAISFCSHEETKYLRSIEKMIGKKVPVTRFDRDTAVVERNGSGDQNEKSPSAARPRRKKTYAERSRTGGGEGQSGSSQRNKSTSSKRRRRPNRAK